MYYVLIIFLIGITQKLYADVSYYITFPTQSPWGLYNQSNTIINNKGVAGIVEETAGQICQCVPSLPFGVVPWINTVSTTYSCLSSSKQAAKAAQKSATSGNTTCQTVTSSSQKTIDYAQFFKDVAQFAKTLEATLTETVNSFPDYAQGQSPESTDYLHFAQKYSLTSTVKGPIETTENYFPQGVITIALDFTQLTATATQIQQAQNVISQLGTSEQQEAASGNQFGNL